MIRTRPILVLGSLFLSCLLAAAQDARIIVHADAAGHPYSRYLAGACLEDVNHEVYGGLYSQMVFGESFQEPPPPVPLQGFTASGGHWQVQDVSGMWRGFRTGSAQGSFLLETNQPFLGRQSQRLAFVGGEGEIGIENQGLNRWGMNFVEGKRYEGHLWARAEQPTELWVALESADGKSSYARARLRIGAGTWTRADFHLQPSRSDPAGQFALKLKQPGSVCLGYVFLEPGGWGRFKGLAVRKDVAEALVAQGLTVLRYGGSMVNAPEYRWKKMVGPRDRRPPYHGTWYPYSSNGWGIFDFLDFCEAAGFLGVPAVNMDETPQDMADFVEYANGRATSGWGRRRAADGHRAPYHLRYLELGNEEAIDEAYWQRFKPLAEAIWAKDPDIILVVGDFAYDKAIQDPFRFGGAPRIHSLAAHQKILDLARTHGREVWFDVHINTEQPPEPRGLPGVRSFSEALGKLSPGARYKVAVFEFNAGNHALKRALANACALSQLEQLGDRIGIACSANCLQPDRQNDNGWDQGLLFLSPSQVWPQPPYFVTQMVSREALPICIPAEVNSPGGALDVTAARTGTGKALVLQVVNIAANPVTATLTLEGFTPRKPTANVTVLTGAWDAVNTPAEPTRVRPVHQQWTHQLGSGPASYNFPPHSFTVLRFD